MQSLVSSRETADGQPVFNCARATLRLPQKTPSLHPQRHAMNTDPPLPLDVNVIIATTPGQTFNPPPGQNAVSFQNATSAVGAYLITSADTFGLAKGDVYHNVQTLIGSSYADYLWGDGNNNNLYGEEGADALYGFAHTTNSVTHLYGGGGMDTLLGGMGIDVIDGGGDEDTVSYYLSPTGLTISLTNPSINTGWAAGDTYTSVQDVIGSNFNDVIYGSTEGLLNQLQGQDGNDVIHGGTGYNVLIGGAGADTLYGVGVGNNLVDYEIATSGLTASLGNPSINTGDAAGDIYIDLVNGDLAGTPYGDILYGDAQNNHIIGDPNPNDYGGRFGNDYLFGGDGDDIIEGNLGGDAIDGGAGVDYAAYSTATSAVHASLAASGANTGEAAGDTYTGIEGLFGSNFNDVLAGDANSNSLFGEQGDDQIFGGGGDDILVGGAGADQLDGGTGFNYASFGAAITVSLANASLNTGEAAGDTYVNVQGLLGSSYNDTLYGDGSVNVIQGGAGNDTIYGGGGNDLLTGGEGDDVLIAGKGTSQLYGDVGADTFKFVSAGDSQKTEQIAPTELKDFQTGVDKIDISAIQPQSFQILQENGFYTLAAVTASGTLYVRSTSAFVANDVITSVAGQMLTGGAGYDQLAGGVGADVLIGKGGGDNLTGGAGPDTFRYQAASDSTPSAYDILADFQHGVDKIDLTAVAPTYISLLHSQGATFIFPSTSGGQMQIAAIGDVEGNDILTGAATNYYIVGDNTAATLIGGAYSDAIVGGTANDTLIGGASGDALFGGAGANTFAYASAADSNNTDLDIIHDFKAGVDKLDLSGLAPSNVSILHYNGGTFINGGGVGGAFQIGSIASIDGSDILGLTNGVYIVGENLAATLIGSAKDDTIVGGSGNDRIIGGATGDALFGGTGADTFVFTQSADSNGNAGMLDILHDFQTGVDKIDLTALQPQNLSILHYNGGTFIFAGSPSGSFELASTQDINASDLIGLTGGAYLVGDEQTNTLVGAAFSETIVGGEGNDVIMGGGAADALFGGGGADTFKFTTKSDSVPGAPDIIHDFQSGADKIDLTALHTNGANDHYSLVSDANASYLFVQLAGNTDNDMQILFTTPNVHASDILW
jgi:Ca2+-binding RTX toxin-like protein